MHKLHFPHRASKGPVTDIVSPENAPLKWLRLRRIDLTANSPEWAFETGEEEAVLDIFGGLCTVNINGGAGDATFPEIGGRPNVFSGRPTMVYIPKGARVSLYAESPSFEAVLVSAQAGAVHPPALIHPEETQSRVVGKDNWQRTVVTGVGDNVKADRLIVGETINPPGNWSSAPPHKHDCHGEGKRRWRRCTSTNSIRRRASACRGSTPRPAIPTPSRWPMPCATATQSCCRAATIRWWLRRDTTSSTSGR